MVELSSRISSSGNNGQICELICILKIMHEEVDQNAYIVSIFTSVNSR